MSAPRRSVHRVALLGAALALAGSPAACAPADDEAEDVEIEVDEDSGLSSSEMGSVAARIYLEPERAEEIADEAGMTAEEFEARVRAITNDPEESGAYASAFEDGLAAAGGAPPDDPPGGP